MNVLECALRTIAQILESDFSLQATIARFERDFAHIFDARVVIRLDASAVVHDADANELTYALVVDGSSIGIVTFSFDRERSTAQCEDLRTIIPPLSVVLAWRSRQRERERMSELVRTDALTGLANRLAFDEYVTIAWRDALEDATALTIALVDIDFFKSYNDGNGHLAGDTCLRQVGAILAERGLAEECFVARFGGEEFAVVAERRANATAVATIERMLRAFEERPILHEGSSVGRITLSAGVACTIPTRDRNIAMLLGDADRQLYRAKALGRNRICSEALTTGGALVSRLARRASPATEFPDTTIGRDADLTRILGALRQARAVTLVGEAGIGKSRLARATYAAAERFSADGAIYVDLTYAQDYDPYETLGAALDLAVEAGDIRESVRNVLHDRSVLVILDNVAGAAVTRVGRLCMDLLAAAPDVTVLVTSQTRISFASERIVVVSALEHDDAIALLRERSGSTDIVRLQKIVANVGGNPRAIETAARKFEQSYREALDTSR